ncbi:MAG: (Fe-S)-binding protein [Solidesulfovibrio sp.]|uniref:(Fe-S)-binding protein n=1 Tax=Solidesulfovibrio sp. TaxID=2910990 RepID=UPI003158290F
METALLSPAKAWVFFLPARALSIAIVLVGLTIFAVLLARRLKPMLRAAPDRRFDRLSERVFRVLKIWLAQWRQPRYPAAGILHIVIFAGFLCLSVRSVQMVILGMVDGFVFPGFSGPLGEAYDGLRQVMATAVLAASLVSMVRRGILKPARYAVPARYGREHTAEAVFVLALISLLMLTEGLFDGTLAAAAGRQGVAAATMVPGSVAWLFARALGGASPQTLQFLHVAAYFAHDLTFFFFLCFLPLGKHFHVVTSLFNVFCMRLDRGNVKPVRYGLGDDQLDTLDAFGVKKIEDFTWKHLLDFYSCADCGRCSDNCPANAVGRPLSPRFLTIKARDLLFAQYPAFHPGRAPKESPDLIGGIYTADEIWSCTTCGACEEECPVGIEYIDKIVDLRRGMIEAGHVPQSLQKPLRALETRGNPWGKMEKKRGDWAKEAATPVAVKPFEVGDTVDTLFFVDSITSYDDRMQRIAQATARVLAAVGTDFAILGKHEKDSGHEARRFGEEMLFQDLRTHNTEMILASGARRVVTADPHAYNALVKDYGNLPPVEHVCQTMVRGIRDGSLRLHAARSDGKVYAYHDPCYLGRHNGLYEEPRAVLDAIPGLRRVEMRRSRDRSFCCGGGGLMLFYEPEEEQRMGVLRVRMAAEAGANVMVTACPFCLVNMEDAIKVAGLEGSMEAVDLVELVDRHLA